MKYIRLRKHTYIFLFIWLLIIKSSNGYGQSDSISYWQNAILKASTEESAVKICQQTQSYITRRDSQYFISDVDTILNAAVNTRFSKTLFNELLFNLSIYSKIKNKEVEFTRFVLKLEYNPHFSNEDVQNQLFYFYSVLFFNLKEYFYAEKYCIEFLKNGQHAFPEYSEPNHTLNAMTILALIDSKKKDFKGALLKFRNTLDSSIAKKSDVWTGITKGNIAYVYYQEGKYLESINFLKEDVKASLQYKEWGSAMSSYLTLQDIYLKLDQPEKANQYLDSAHFLLQKIIGDNPFNERYYLKEAFDIHTSLASRFYKKNDYINASKYYEKALEIKKIKDQEEKDAEIKKIIQANEMSKSFNEINILKEEIKSKKQTLLYSIVITISVFIILIIYTAFYRKLKQANKSLTVKSEIIEHQNIVLEKINNDKDRLFSIISHDLRGPSNNLHLIFKSVADKKLPPSILEDQLPNILKNSTNLINTLESLLTWSFSQLKGIIANKEKVDIIESIENNILFFEDQAQKKSIKLINQCHSKMVLIDKNHIEIILRNFTSNAIKFSKQNSSIEFNQIDHKDHVEISVTDYGYGLTEDQIHNIMNSTAMKSVVGTSGEKGIGLGLLLTKEFIEINGGVLKIKSTIKEGTIMSFTIPKAI